MSTWKISTDDRGYVIVNVPSSKGQLTTRCRLGVSVDDVKAALRGVELAGKRPAFTGRRPDGTRVYGQPGEVADAGRAISELIRERLFAAGLLDGRCAPRVEEQRLDRVTLRTTSTRLAAWRLAATKDHLTLSSWIEKVADAAAGVADPPA